MTEKRNIHALIEKEAPSLNNLLDPEDVKEFKAMTAELRDTWTKKQVFRTETEMRMSVLQDMKYPTKAAKYWQCVREQNVFLENLMSLSFDCRRQESKIEWLKRKIASTESELERADGAPMDGPDEEMFEWRIKKEYQLEKYKIDLDESRYGLANMQLVARDRMREIKLWSTLIKEFDDGSFDTQDVNRHQLDSYHLIMQNKAETLSARSSQPEIFNVLGQLKSIERVKKSGEMIYNKKEQLTNDLGAKPKV